jgi:formyl-CoA transferase
VTAALEGIRVVDQTQVMAGPTCTMLLADMGAEVIKVEPPGGEHMRHGELELKPGVAAPFLAVNRGKKSLTVDLKQPAGVEILRRLAATADVLVENYRPGVAARLGVDYATLAALNPRLVYCSISGFGQTGPYAGRGGYDLVAQGMSGIMSVTGRAGGPPVKVGVPIADLGAGLLGVFGILCALRARKATGRGQLVDTSLFEAGLALSWREAQECWRTGRPPGPSGAAERAQAPAQAFRARDGHFTVVAGDQARWPRFAALLGLGRLARDPRFAGPGERLAHRDELEREIEAVTVREPRAHWVARCVEAGLPAGPVASVPEALADPHTRAREMVRELDHPDVGPVQALGNPVKLSRSPAGLDRSAPRLGEDTDALLRALGYRDGDLAALRRSGVV